VNEVRTKDEEKKKNGAVARGCVGSSTPLIFKNLRSISWVSLLCISETTIQINNIHIISNMSDESTFLFTSESVNEGHPGE
jgi:hypothetical protein